MGLYQAYQGGRGSSPVGGRHPLNCVAQCGSDAVSAIESNQHTFLITADIKGDFFNQLLFKKKF